MRVSPSILRATWVACLALAACEGFVVDGPGSHADSGCADSGSAQPDASNPVLTDANGPHVVDVGDGSGGFRTIFPQQSWIIA